MVGTERLISPGDVRIDLDISDSTLRKWCLALEKQGYYFTRTDNNRRVFFERDLEVLRYFRYLVKVQNFNLENAAAVVSSRFKGSERTPSEQANSENGDVLPSGEVKEMIEKLLDHIERQEAFNKELLKRLDEQQRYIEERIDKRDQLLMQTLREHQQQTQKLIAAAEEEKLPWYKKLFKK